MIYCVFLEPESFKLAATGDEIHRDHLIGVLRCLLENCLLAETKSWRIGAELKAAVQSAEDNDTKTKLGALLETFSKRDRFVEAVDDEDFEWDAKISRIAASQKDNQLLDLIIAETGEEHSGSVETSTITRFNQSNFSQTRQRNFSKGVTLEPGDCNHKDLFKKCFGRMLMACKEFTLVDYKIGESFGQNYYENLPYWIDFLKSCNRPVTLRLITTKGSNSIIKSIQNRLDDLTAGSTVSTNIETWAEVPHERFFRSAAFSLNIGRGIDLCMSNGMNRDISVRVS